MTLKADLRAMADAIALPDSDLHKRIESALHAAVKLVREPLLMLVELKDIKERIESGAATPEMDNYYRQNKELAWKMARDAAQLLREIEE